MINVYFKPFRIKKLIVVDVSPFGTASSKNIATGGGKIVLKFLYFVCYALYLSFLTLFFFPDSYQSINLFDIHEFFQLV